MEAQRPVLNIPARELRLNRRAITFLACLIISALLWILISLSESFLERRYFPVKYLNIPQDVPAQSLPDTLSVEFTATGFNLLFHDPGDEPLVLDCATAPSSADQQYYFLPNALVARQFNRQFGSEMKIVRLLPDTMKFMRLRGEGRWLKVKFGGKVNFQGTISIVDSVRVIPDSVFIRGNSAGSWLTLTSAVNGKEGKNTIPVPVSIPWEGAISETDSVWLQFTGEKFTEKEFRIPVTVVGLPEGYSFKAVPREVSVKCLVPFSQLQESGNIIFSATVDYKEMISQNLSKARVSVVSPNKSIKNLRSTPERVDFILRKNKDA